MTYATVADEILAERPRTDRHRELVRRSDDLLERLESLNLGHYGSLKAWSSLDTDCRLTSDLVAAINGLAAELGFAPRRLRTSREALDAVFELQAVIFGHPDNVEDPL